jgi:hypothetical protein
VAAEIEARAQEWRRQHPSPAERLAQLEREQNNIATSIAESARFASQMYRLRRSAGGPDLRPVPAVPRDTSLRIGPAFDLLTGGNGNPSNVRR